MGSEALARIGPAELGEGLLPSDLDLLAPAPPPEEALPLPPPPAPPLPPPPPPLPGEEDCGSPKGKPHLRATLKSQVAVPPLGRSQGHGWKDVKLGGKALREGKSLRLLGKGYIKVDMVYCKDRKGAIPDSSEDGHGEGSD